MYAVTAITGKVGGVLARTLLRDGEGVRAVVRDEAKGKGAVWAARGCEVAVADVGDPDTLSAALSDVDGAFILLPPNFDPLPCFADVKATIESIRRAVVAAKPPKVVVLSTIGADSPKPNLLNALGFLEHALADSPTRATFLRPAWFMENAAWDVASAREGLVRSYLHPVDRAIPMVSTEDVGRAAAELIRGEWSGDRVVELEGPARVSPNDLAGAFGRALARPVRAEPVPREDWERIFRAEGMRNPEPRMRMIDGFSEGWIDFADRGAHARKGVVTIDQAIAALVKT